MEVGVRRANLGDPMLAHQCGCVEIVDRISSQSRVVGDQLSQNLFVPIGLDEKRRQGSSQDRLDPGLRGAEIEWTGEHARVRADAEELVDDPPSQEPGSFPMTPLLQQLARSEVVRRIGVYGVQKQVGVDYKQGSGAFHRSVQGIPVSDVDERPAHRVDREGWEVARWQFCKSSPERLGDNSRKGFTAAGRSTFQFSHDRVGDDQRRFHMENNTIHMELRQRCRSLGSLGMIRCRFGEMDGRQSIGRRSPFPLRPFSSADIAQDGLVFRQCLE
jgi:hypothetical protein